MELAGFSLGEVDIATAVDVDDPLLLERHEQGLVLLQGLVGLAELRLQGIHLLLQLLDVRRGCG